MSYILLSNTGVVEFLAYRKFQSPGESSIYSRNSFMEIKINYFPNRSFARFNFVQTVYTNFSNDDATKFDGKKIEASDIKLEFKYYVDGFNDYGTFYTPEELLTKKTISKGLSSRFGHYFRFDDFPGRIFIENKEVTWKAELSIVEFVNGKNIAVVTFDWGFILSKDRKHILLTLKKSKKVSTFHLDAIKSALIS